MDRRSMLISTFAGACGWAGLNSLAEATETPSSATLPWYYDLYEAHRISIQTGRPLLVVFGARWCRYCQKLEETTLRDKSLQQHIIRNFVPVTLNLDRNRSIARILEVKSIPSTVILNPQADLLGRIVGYVEADQYRQVLVSASQFQARIEQAQHVERTDSRSCPVPPGELRGS